MTRRISLVLFILFIFLLNSCFAITISSMRTVRNEITRNSKKVTAVGIITDWTYSDGKFIAVELKLDDDKILFLPLVNYQKWPGWEPFHVSRIGNYAFASIVHTVNKKSDQGRIRLRTNRIYSLPELSAKTGIQIRTMNDIINYYDDIYNFVESLPTVDEHDYEEIFEKGILVSDGFGEDETYSVTIYPVKTIWDDKYYGIGRKPDYDNNELFGGYRSLERKVTDTKFKEMR